MLGKKPFCNDEKTKKMAMFVVRRTCSIPEILLYGVLKFGLPVSNRAKGPSEKGTAVAPKTDPVFTRNPWQSARSGQAVLEKTSLMASGGCANGGLAENNASMLEICHDGKPVSGLLCPIRQVPTGYGVGIGAARYYRPRQLPIERQ